MSLSKIKSNPESVNSRGKVDSTQLQDDDYRRIIMQLQSQINIQNGRLKGVQALTAMLMESEELCKRLEEKAGNYEMSLKRAEARIAQLNTFHGIGPQTAFNRGVVMPGVSRKDFELVTRENLKLKNALEHIVPTNLGGPQVLLKMKELHDLVSTLKDNLCQSDHHIKELESALRGSGNNDLRHIPELERKVMNLERLLNAKQVFCEGLIKEIDQLKAMKEETSGSQKQEDNQDCTDGGNQEREEQALKINVLNEEIKTLQQENTMLKQHLQRMEQTTKESLEESNLKFDNQASELVVAQRERLQETQQIVELTKEHAVLKKKCDGFFQQVVSLNSKQKESEEELCRMKRAFDNQKAEVDEKKAMIHLMSESLKSYEDDFRRENEEKAKYQKLVDKAQQDTERTKRENMSHMATVKHLEDEFERMSQMLTEERKKGNDMKHKRDFLPQTFAVAGHQNSRSMFQDTRRRIAIADGYDESDGKHQIDTPSLPTTKSETANAPSLIECPYCSRSYPYHLIEGHVQDCMEDSLYMDEK